ncbi:uncharacterized protein LOC116297381 [Actinia tenebrosa]|uniref:Uncharacterized protein LOC116297381 n=1 Tax=Actinia tenebrosa TaxID=6105 RepID=A0A6P8I145_ACTTE|nr:uncharacterized protein LOC116297381 [Actinia tenebrosa]
MLIGSNRKLAKNTTLSISILNHNIDSVSSFKYLGVFLSSDFTWSEHVEYVTNKVNQRLSLLSGRIKHLLACKSRLLFYNSLVLPLFDYADTIWGDKNNTSLISSLQILQNKAAKIILDKQLHSSATETLTALKWISLVQRRFQRRCIFVYKCLNGLLNHHMNLQMNKEQDEYNTRNKDHLRLHKVTKTKVRLSSGQRLKLNKDIRNSESINIFKKRVFSYIIQ